MVISVVLLVVSVVLLFDKLFAPQPIQVVLETGQEVTTQEPSYYPLSEVLLLVAASFIIGATAIYIYYNSEEITSNFIRQKGQETGKDIEDRYKRIIPLLKKDEKVVFSALKDSKGVMLQNQLVLKTAMSKVAVTRALAKLEMKNLVIRERFGLTNKVRIKE